MNATIQVRTTIGQLVYRAMPQIDFRRLVADLDSALAGSGAGSLQLVNEREDFALVDVGASRIGVALTGGLDRKGAAAVIVTVGYGPSRQGDASLARRQSVLARLIADRIAARHAPQETVWTTSDEVAAPKLFERCRGELASRLEADLQARAERARARRARSIGGIEATDVSRLFGRFEATLSARRSGLSDPDEVVDVVKVDLKEAVALKDAHRGATARMRLAAHLMDATLMVVALPVGAAMMIYSLSRGADLNYSARAMALSGTGIAFLHGAGGISGLQSLLQIS